MDTDFAADALDDAYKLQLIKEYCLYEMSTHSDDVYDTCWDIMEIMGENK